MRYVALGDSYTIGTSVAEHERWPDQLVARLAAEARSAGGAPPLELVANLAVNGFTAHDVITVELPRLAPLRPEVVSLLVGVNDVIRGIADSRFRADLEAILDHVLGLDGVRLAFGVTTPDYTVTPAGADYGDPAIVGSAIERRNREFTKLFVARDLPVVEIRDLSLRAAADRTLVARDGLHPSGEQYRLWVDRIAPIVAAELRALRRG